MMTTPAPMLSSPQAEELSRLVARIRALAPSLPAELLREAGTCVLGLAEGVENSAEDTPVLPLRLAFTDQQAEPTEVGDRGSVGSLEGEEHLADEPGDDAAEAAERSRETATLRSSVGPSTRCHSRRCRPRTTTASRSQGRMEVAPMAWTLACPALWRLLR